MIHLINRRFVPFFFNTSGMGEGDDEAAQKFVEGKLENPHAYLSIFDPVSGEHLDTSEIYADKDRLFEFLKDLLDEHPEYDQFDRPEQSVIAAASARPESAEALLAAAELQDELGNYEESERLGARVLALGHAPREASARALRMLTAQARHTGQWKRVESLCDEAERRDLCEDGTLGADVAMERAYRDIALGEYGRARERLEAALDRYPSARRRGELRFYAGVACWFLDEEEAADRHWCWVQETIPDDVMARRCYIAVAREAMPYANPELDGYAAQGLPGGSIRLIKEAYAAARERFLETRGELGPGQERQ